MDLANVPLLKGLKQDEIEGIQKISMELTYPKGVTMFVEGQESDGLYIVNSGLLKVVKLHKGGMEKTLAILKEGEILGEMTLFGTDLRSATVETLEDTIVTFITRHDFQALLKKVPELSLRLIEVLSSRLRQSNRQIEELIIFNARSRVVSNLLYLVEEKAREGLKDANVISLTSIDLAYMIGVSLDAVEKLLKEFQESNLVKVSGEQFEITDINELYNLVR